MDSVFSFGEGDRDIFIQQIIQSVGCTYICLWSYYQYPYNCLRYKGGFYHERSNLQPSSSYGSLAQRLFIEYGQSIINVDSSHIPGLAFLENTPYMELHLTDLQRMASIETQRHFYQVAGIKKALFMGCKEGEIELGFSDESSGVNLEMEMRTWFPEDFNRQLAPARDNLPQPSTDHNRPASSSSSLRSLSYDSSEYSPLLFDLPSTSYVVPEQQQEAAVQGTQGLAPPLMITAITPQQQAIHSLSQIRNAQLPTIESENAAITRAILAVISSSPASTSSPMESQQQNLPPNNALRGSRGSAFKWYRSALAPRMPISSTIRRQNMIKRSFAFLRTLNSLRAQEPMQAGRTSATQMHHMISERRRRERLNESFQALRSFLPPGTKKDKASVLSSTTEYLSSLKAQVAELSKRNQILEAQLLPQKSTGEETSTVSSGSSNDQRVEVQITNVAASTSAARFVDVLVTVRRDISMVDLVVSLLEFLKTDHNVNLMSVEANTRAVEAALVNNVVLRLRIEDGEWDESAFQEAVRRVANDMGQ